MNQADRRELDRLLLEGDLKSAVKTAVARFGSSPLENLEAGELLAVIDWLTLNKRLPKALFALLWQEMRYFVAETECHKTSRSPKGKWEF